MLEPMRSSAPAQLPTLRAPSAASSEGFPSPFSMQRCASALFALAAALQICLAQTCSSTHHLDYYHAHTTLLPHRGTTQLTPFRK